MVINTNTDAYLFTGNLTAAYITANIAVSAPTYYGDGSHLTGITTGGGSDVSNLSANWQNSFTTLTANSANWNSVWTTVCSFSAGWGTGTGGDAAVNSLVHSSSSLWNVGGYMPIPLTANSTVGGITQNTIFTINTNLSTILQRLLVAAIPYTYISPTLSFGLSSTTPTSYEIGTNISPCLTSFFTQNDGGSATNFTVLTSLNNSTYANLTSVSLTLTRNINTLSAYNTPYFYLTANTYFKQTINYAQGYQGYDNYGNASGTPLPASSVTSNSVLLSVYRNIFYTSDTLTPALTTSDNIRALTSTPAQLANQVLSINTHSGDTRFGFAYPAEYAITSVGDPTNGTLVNTINANTITTYFTVSTISVSGANGLAPNNYRVYKYKSIPPTNTFTINSSYNISVQNPDTAVPTSSVSPNAISVTTEAGYLTAATLTYGYTKHGGGNQTALDILSSTSPGGPFVVLSSIPSPTTNLTYITPGFKVSDSTSTTAIYFKVSANYSAGSQLYTNYNDPYGTPVVAGNVTNTTSVSTIGQFRVYVGTTSATAPTDVQIRTGSTGVIIVSALQNTRPFSTTNGNYMNNSILQYKFTMDTTPRFLYLAYPTFMETTTPTFKVNGYSGTYFTQSTIKNFTNQYGASADYYLWRSDNAYVTDPVYVDFTG